MVGFVLVFEAVSDGGVCVGFLRQSLMLGFCVGV